jgi:hypothetical protein
MWKVVRIIMSYHWMKHGSRIIMLAVFNWPWSDICNISLYNQRILYNIGPMLIVIIPGDSGTVNSDLGCYPDVVSYHLSFITHVSAYIVFFIWKTTLICITYNVPSDLRTLWILYYDPFQEKRLLVISLWRCYII